MTLPLSSHKTIYGVDIDGCLADFSRACADLYIEVTGKDRFPPGWRDDPLWPSVWNWDTQAGYTYEESQTVWNSRILNNRTFWRDLPPLPQADVACSTLNLLAKKGHAVYFLTHRWGWHAKHQTDMWLYNMGIDYPTTLLSLKKLDLIHALGISWFIDDKPSTLYEVGKGMLHEPSVKIFVCDAPYNRDEAFPLNVRRIPSVYAALEGEFT